MSRCIYKSTLQDRLAVRLTMNIENNFFFILRGELPSNESTIYMGFIKHYWAIKQLEFEFLVGLGYTMVICNTMVAIYYNIVICWCIYYFLSSMTSQLPWATCQNSWNTELCVSNEDLANTTGSFLFIIFILLKILYNKKQLKIGRSHFVNK